MCESNFITCLFVFSLHYEYIYIRVLSVAAFCTLTKRLEHVSGQKIDFNWIFVLNLQKLRMLLGGLKIITYPLVTVRLLIHID